MNNMNREFATQEVIDRILGLKIGNPSIPYIEIAEILNNEFPEENRRFGYGSVRGIWRRNKLQDEPEGTQVESKLSEGIRRPITSTNEHLEAYQIYLGTTDKEFKPLFHRSSNWRSVVAVGDLHGRPSMELARKIIDADPDTIIVGGDILDMQEINPHGTPRELKRSTIQEELTRCRAWFEYLLLNTRAEIIIMTGNHDIWLQRKISEVLPVELMEFFNDPLDVLIAGLPSTRVFKHIQQWNWQQYGNFDAAQSFGSSRFMLCYGDAFISHANFTGKWSGAAVMKLSQWLPSWQKLLGIGEVGLFVQFHGHKSSLSYELGGYQVWCEPGMGGEPSIESYKMVYQGAWRPGNVSCVKFNQKLEEEIWKTDLNSVCLILP